MLIDIFSSFDIYEFTFFSFKTMKIILVSFMLVLTLLMMSNFWMKSYSMMNLLVTPLLIINDQINRTNSKNLKGLSLTLVPLFLILIHLNLGGLISYSFSTSSHLMFTLIVAFPLWLSLIISSFMANKKQFIAHFLPEGAPNWLNPFLVLIESVSISVRPLTLSFRLAANMTAGHIVLSLMGSYLSMSIKLSIIYPLLLSTLMTIYILFEIAICIIQAYIFCLLLTLYTDDHTQP